MEHVEFDAVSVEMVDGQAVVSFLRAGVVLVKAADRPSGGVVELASLSGRLTPQAAKPEVPYFFGLSSTRDPSRKNW